MAETTIGAKLTLDTGSANKSMKEFKQEVKDARTDLLNMSATFGATSKEALKAAKHVAQLEDNLKDASETAKLFDPGNKFAVMGNAVRGLVGGFTALQGALALAGVEGEDLQKTLLKVQGALAITEGLNTVADVTKDFKRLGSVLVQTLGKSGLIGIAIAGVAALGLAIAGVFSNKQSAAVKALNDSLKDYSKAAADARQKTVEVKVAFEQARAGVITKEQALKVYNDTLGDSLGKTDNLATAEKNLADKADAYIKITALKAQANALFAKAAESVVGALIIQDQLAKENIQTGGITGAAVSNANRIIEKTKSDAKEIEALGASLLKQAGELSKAFNINTGSPVDSKKPAAQKAKEEAEELRGVALAKYEAEKAIRDMDLADIEAAKNRKIEIDNELKASDANLATAVMANNNAKIEGMRQAILLAEQEATARTQAARDVGAALGALSDLIGKQTAAGKTLAIAQAVINMWLGVTEVLKTKSTLPEPFATISRIASITTVIATGLNAIKNIGKANVPGSGSSSPAGGGSVSAPLQPQAPGATNTLLNQQQLNQIGNATVRAFVLESDVSSNQERIRRLNRSARI